ncbi:MAG: hypothetical protein GY765_15025 [bacterium]|nr:hypothetical protein [bacterium]
MKPHTVLETRHYNPGHRRADDAKSNARAMLPDLDFIIRLTSSARDK